MLCYAQRPVRLPGLTRMIPFSSTLSLAAQGRGFVPAPSQGEYPPTPIDRSLGPGTG